MIFNLVSRMNSMPNLVTLLIEKLSNSNILRKAIWNANSLHQRSLATKTFLNTLNIDVLLISDSHFSEKHHLNIYGYDIYNTRYPDDKSHGNTAVIIKQYRPLWNI